MLGVLWNSLKSKVTRSLWLRKFICQKLKNLKLQEARASPWRLPAHDLLPEETTLLPGSHETRGEERVCCEAFIHMQAAGEDIDPFRNDKEKGSILLGGGLALCGLLLQRNIVECYYSYLLPVKYEPFSHVIPIFIFFEEFTAWKRRQS